MKLKIFFKLERNKKYTCPHILYRLLEWKGVGRYFGVTIYINSLSLTPQESISLIEHVWPLQTEL